MSFHFSGMLRVVKFLVVGGIPKLLHREFHFAKLKEGRGTLYFILFVQCPVGLRKWDNVSLHVSSD